VIERSDGTRAAHDRNRSGSAAGDADAGAAVAGAGDDAVDAPVDGAVDVLGDAAAAQRRLLDVMRRLRDPVSGCPWDVAQDFASIAPYTIEEAYEVADAIDTGDADALRGELGDLLFQVVFHARIAEERGWFDYAAVARGIADKLVQRHPHVFGDGGARDAPTQQVAWETHKAQERSAAGQHGALEGVALGLPALRRAAKLGQRAARVGFDWSSAADVRVKVDEELAEADAPAGAHARAEEIGDLLFAVAQWARHLGIDPEDALRSASRKFERRFAAMERFAAADGRPLKDLRAADWDALWNLAKAAQKPSGS
jgi:nucleoside triphosphate diphosphatase